MTGERGRERPGGGASAARPRAAELLRLAAAAIVVPLIGWAFWALVLRLGPNDFHDYWLAGKLILEGHSPYDQQAMAALAAREHLSFSLGGGYSYPLPFAVAMAPFGALPFDVAVGLFDLLSLVACGLTTAALVGWACGWEAAAGRRRVGLALAAGAFPPVYGTVVMGQANLILFPLLGAGAVLALDPGSSGRRAAGGGLVGLTAVVKLVPGALALPLALGRRFGAAVGVVVAAGSAILAASVAAPFATAGSGGLASLFDADPYYTNQSINGFVTRLVQISGKSMPLWTGAFDPRPAMLLATGLFGLATLAILWHARPALAERGGMAVALGFVLVAATIGAPKNSFWNESAVLVAVALLVAVDDPGPWSRAWPVLDRALLAAWFGFTTLWAIVWAVEPPRSSPFSAPLNLLWSSSMYGLLALWWLLARRLGARPSSGS